MNLSKDVDIYIYILDNLKNINFSWSQWRDSSPGTLELYPIWLSRSTRVKDMKTTKNKRNSTTLYSYAINDKILPNVLTYWRSKKIGWERSTKLNLTYLKKKQRIYETPEDTNIWDTCTMISIEVPKHS